MSKLTRIRKETIDNLQYADYLRLIRFTNHDALAAEIFEDESGAYLQKRAQYLKSKLSSERRAQISKMVGWIEPTNLKTCICCNLKKPTTEFFRLQRSTDGFSYYCKECQKTGRWRQKDATNIED